MAEYENLTTLEGLQVGDTVKYTKANIIDFKGYKIQVELIGESSMANWVVKKNAGYSKFDLDTSKLSSQVFNWSRLNGSALMYGDTVNKYNAIAVAGDCGKATGNSSARAGGGINAEDGESFGSEIFKGGGQTLPNPSIIWNSSYDKEKLQYYTAPNFNVNDFTATLKRGYSSYSIYKYLSGNGWYPGTVYVSINTSSPSSVLTGGGSGFILGAEGTSYPTGYFSDDEALINTMKSAISNPELITGKYSTNEIRAMDGDAAQNTFTYGRMILTILALPGAEAGNSIKYYTNGAWKDATMKVYTNGVWKSASPKVYKNSTWK